MSHNHIKRLMSAALLFAFMMPSGVVIPACNANDLYQSAMVLSGDVKLTEENESITLSLRDSDVKQVLRMFADKVGKNIVFHSSVNGKITLDLVDMPINEAFSLVLQIAGLNYYTRNNTLILIAKDNPDNASYSKQEMMIFPVKYVDAGKIANFLNKNVFGMKKSGMSSVDAATVNAATNEIIVFGMKSDAAIVEKVIAQLDREPLSKTFAVNHTTPAEMANLICEMLLPSRGSSSGSSGGSAPTRDIPPTPGMGTGGAAGILTGGAASTSSDSGLKLGEGIVACSVSSSAAGSASVPFDVQNLSVAYFPQRGTITLMGGSYDQQRMVENFIKANDVKQPQAYMEVAIIELTEEGSKEFHNEWNLDSKNWLFSFSGDTTSLGRASNPGQSVQEQMFGNGSYLSWQMSYLIRNKKARILANPKFMITNGQESVIDLTQDYVEKVTSEFLSSTGSGIGATGSVQRTYTIGKDKGIKITLMPFISPEGYVTLNIKPEYSTEDGPVNALVYDPTTGDSTEERQATLLSRRNLDLKNIRIKDNETLAIGGLIQEEDTKEVYKIPFLGDLPVIGAAFRSEITKRAKKEMVILLTPKIINDGEGAIADSL